MTRTTLMPGLDVSRETEERLRALTDLVEKWTRSINLVSQQTLPQMWQRHVLDSAQLFTLAPRFNHWADLGAGGGFPGLVVAILAAEHAPTARISLVESDGRKATFLRSANRALGLTATVHTARIEALNPLGADILSARALGALDLLLNFAALHLAPAGMALFPKGRTAPDEIAAARANWLFDLESHPSMTDQEAAILRIKGIARA